MFISYNLLIVGYGSIANSCAIFYYIKELNEQGHLIPNEIKLIQDNIEKNIKSLEKFVIGWQNQCLDIVDKKLRIGAKFINWRL